MPSIEQSISAFGIRDIQTAINLVLTLEQDGYTIHDVQEYVRNLNNPSEPWMAQEFINYLARTSSPYKKALWYKEMSKEKRKLYRARILSSIKKGKTGHG